MSEELSPPPFLTAKDALDCIIKGNLVLYSPPMLVWATDNKNNKVNYSGKVKALWYKVIHSRSLFSR